MRGLEFGAGLAVIAVIVVFFGGGELLGDILRDGSPGIEIRLVAVSGACRGIAMPTNSVASAIISAATSVMRRPEAETREPHES